MDRREFLASAGGLAGIIGLGGYHQRRRLRRWSDRDALRAALALEPPDPRPRTMLTVTESHAAAAVDGLEWLVADAQAAWTTLEIDDDPRKRIAHVESRLDDAAAELEAADERLAAFGTLSADDRLALLEDLRTALRGASHALALADVTHGDRDLETIVDDLGAVEDEYAAVADDLAYRATDLSRAVAAYADLDELLEDVRRAIGAGRRALESDVGDRRSAADTTVSLADDMLARAAMRVPYARARLADVERFAAQLADDAGPDADDLDDALEARYETLRAEIDATVDDVDFSSGAYFAYAWDVWEPHRHPARSDGSDEYGEGCLALAMRIAARQYASALTLEAFADVPSTKAIGADNPVLDDLDTTAVDVRAAKRRAVDALETRLAEDGDDPLARSLCADFADELRHREWRLESALDEINAASAAEWTLALEECRRSVLEVAELAAAVPDVLAVLERG